MLLSNPRILFLLKIFKYKDGAETRSKSSVAFKAGQEKNVCLYEEFEPGSHLRWKSG